jgi:hypothetical protein
MARRVIEPEPGSRDEVRGHQEAAVDVEGQGRVQGLPAMDADAAEPGAENRGGWRIL